MNPVRSCWGIRCQEKGEAWTLLCGNDYVTPTVFASKEAALAHIEYSGDETWKPVRLVPAAGRKKKKAADVW